MKIWALVLVLALLCSLDAKKKAKSKKPEPLSAVALSQYVACEACMKMGQNLHSHAKTLLHGKTSRNKKQEEPILELVEEICEIYGNRGEWMHKYDIIGVQGTLKFEEKKGLGQCGKECKAIAKVCDDTRSEAGDSEIAEMLYRNLNNTDEAEFSAVLCKKMTAVCNLSTKKLKHKRVDEEFKPLETKDWNQIKLETRMQEMGYGGKTKPSQEEMQERMEEFNRLQARSNRAAASPAGRAGEQDDDDEVEVEEVD